MRNNPNRKASAVNDVPRQRTTWLAELPVAGRRLLFFGCAILVAGFGTVFFADLLVRIYGGLTGPMLVLTALFGLLFSLVSLGFTHALFGMLVMPFQRLNITSRLEPHDLRVPFEKTAIVFPIYNEDVPRVFEGLRAVYLSVKKTGRLEDFEFFVLSDSTSIDHWVAEEFAWSRLSRELDAFGRVFYRRRFDNVAKKAGNIADFCRTWGGRYAHMIVMDADSIMRGRDIVRLVALMTKHPDIGLIQTAPRLIGSSSLIGRVQQFANHLYGPIFTAGLNFWQESEGNYWGHNAIIRVQPFTDFCDLPDLPGKEPFGGKILSHDFVEAALMRKAGWEVWLAWDLEGTYEEGPQSIIELAQRDRRWLQGNLQHTWLLFARGLHPANKIHLLMGILGYLASPLWFGFLLVGLVVTHRHNLTGLSVLPVDGWFNKWAPWLSVSLHGWLLFLGTMGILFAPKMFALIYAMLTPGVPRSFGGLPSILSGMIVETVTSTLVAPIFMLFHTKFLVWMFLGKSVTWSAQVRGAVGTTWGQAVAAHTGHSIIGVVWAAIALMVDRMLFLWMSPVLMGMIFSIPLSVITSRPSLGIFLLRLGVLVTPEDVQRPSEVSELIKRLRIGEAQLPKPESLEPYEGVSRAVVDPYVNAVHVSLQQGNPHHPALHEVVDQLATKGPEAIAPDQIKQVLADPEWMLIVHRQIWTTPFGELAPWWRHVVDGYRKAL